MMRQLPIALLALQLAACGGPDPMDKDLHPLTALGENLGFKDLELLGRIKSAKTPEDRERLIAELEATPERIHPYYSRWLVLHDVGPYHCWTDNGYDPSLSDVPRDIQLLAATNYGISDINNGGFHQFFGNSTGGFAPEMAEWFERANMLEAARVINKAIAVFGEQFPRSQAAREKFLAGYVGDKREEWDPFYELDGPFYDAVSRSKPNSDEPVRFTAAANKWLREVCGITDLRMEYKAEPRAPRKRAGN